MSAELWHWRSEAVVYGLMFVNMAGVLCALVWAWRRGYMLGNQDGDTPGLGPDAPFPKETRNG